MKTRVSDSFLKVGSGDHGGGGALDEATLDLVEDEGREVSKRRSVLKWDQKKRKYVETTGYIVSRREDLKRRALIPQVRA